MRKREPASTPAPNNLAEAQEFLQTLFGNFLGGDAFVELRPVPGKPELLNSLEVLPPVDPSRNWYFGVCLRNASREVTRAVAAWVDIDSSDRPHFPPTLQPTVVVSTGRGWQAFWCLKTTVDPTDAVRVSRVLTHLLKGDTSVCEPARVMRLPGSWNVKYPTRPYVSATYLPDAGPWDVNDLLVEALALLLEPYWTPGNRHTIALALPVVLHALGRPVVRALVQSLCERSNDTEVADRLRAVEDTFTRIEAGETVSTFAFFSMLAPDVADTLRRVTGTATTPPNRVIINGEVVGDLSTAEETIARWLVTHGDLGQIEGLPARWVGTHWELIKTGEELRQVVISELRNVFITGSRGTAEVAYRSRKIRIPIVIDLLSHYLREYATQARNALAFPNGTLILDDAAGDVEFIPTHRREDGITTIMPITYDPGARAPRWEHFINEVLPDPADREAIQLWAGYLLVRGNPLQRMLWIYGPSSTGKSTFIDTIATMFGELAYSASATTITSPYSIAMFAGRRLVYTTELASDVLETGIIKQLVSCDPVEARHIYGSPFTLRFTGKLIIVSNVLPTFSQAEGMSRRVHLLQFTRRFEGEEVNPRLAEELREELPGIFNWALAGWREVVRKHLSGSSPAPWRIVSGENVLKMALAVSDNTAMFVQAVFDLGQEHSVEYSLSHLYGSYRTWCWEHSQQSRPVNELTATLHRFGFTFLGGDVVQGPPMREQQFT